MATTVKVNKELLLLKLRENREIHIKEYKELFEAYQSEAIKGLQKLLKNAKNGNIVTHLQITQPVDYTETYDEIIGMLEMSVDDTFEITQEEYKSYVLNQWNWTRNFNVFKTAYGMKL